MSKFEEGLFQAGINRDEQARVPNGRGASIFFVASLLSFVSVFSGFKVRMNILGIGILSRCLYSCA